MEYAVKTRSKEIGNCESLQSPCAKIKIQTLDIKSGVSDPTAVNIELDIEKEILLIEGEEASKAKNIDELVDLLVEEYKNLISDIKDYNLPWEIMYMLDVVNNGRGLLSVVINSYSYRGGAHGISFIRYLNYNLYNGNRITLDSAFVNDVDFVKLCEKSFRLQYGIDERADINEVRFNFPDNRFYIPDNFIFERDYVVFKYNVYEIAPYSEGVIEFKIDLESLRPFIKSDVLKAFISEVASI
ncbi:MAG: DUF3298 domain-containing protein [Thermaurantimonas sp.]